MRSPLCNRLLIGIDKPFGSKPVSLYRAKENFINYYMKIINASFVLGSSVFSAIIFSPSMASADRWHYERGHSSSRPSWSYNHWQRPRGLGSEHAYPCTDSKIRDGIRTGLLSRDELSELRQRRFELSRQRQDYLSDGYLSSRERRDITNDQRSFENWLNQNLNDGERDYRPWFNRWW